jgi:4-amino-4-deoxy-L-arabinose transferase-like glycosyltransferase
VALTIPIYYFGPPVTMYSHNVGQLPIWAATIYIYRRAVLRDGLLNWILLGVATAVLIYAKYSGGLLLAVLGLHLLLTREGRSRLSATGPYIAATILLILLMPNLNWLSHHNYSPFTFAFDRPHVTGILARAYQATKFLFAQVGYHGGVLLLVGLAMARWMPWQGEAVEIETTAPSRFDRWLVLATAFVPLLLMGFMTFWAGVNQRHEIGGSVVALSGLAMVLLLPQHITIRAPRLVTSLWLGVLILLPIGHVASIYYQAQFQGRVATQLWPAKQLSANMQAVWKSRTAKPLDIVTGHFMQAGFVALYADPRPSVFIDADFRKSAWITPERLKKSGTLVVWSTSDFPRTDELPEPYREALKGLTPSFGFLLLPLGYGQTQTYGWAVLLPADSADASPTRADTASN